MSSMLSQAIPAAVLAAMSFLPAPFAAAQGNWQAEAGDWDAARAALAAQGPGQMAPQIARWEQLVATPDLSFSDYATFLLRNPGFPQSDRLRRYAEARLRAEFVPASQLAAFFDSYEPLTNFARAHYALALDTQPARARAMARDAWIGGEMSDTAEAAILARHGASFTAADHDARMDALLWQREPDAARRQLARVSPEKLAVFLARLAILEGGDGAVANPLALSDAGYLFNRSRELRLEGRPQEAVALMTNRPPLEALPFDETAWVEEQLNVAQLADARRAAGIAAKLDEAFEPGEDISTKAFKLRDDYTSLAWLGGTKALWKLGDGNRAAPLFYRYGAAARTPQTRSKGFFWAGHAAARAGDTSEAARYYEMAAQYPERFYGQLALARLGRTMPSFKRTPALSISAEERAEFTAAPLTAAVREVARDAPWSTGIRFYRAIADEAETGGEHLLVAELARDIGRRDLAVNLAEAAMAKGHGGFTRIGFPRLETPRGTDWTMVHAIARQESQFAQNAISHAGARGLMQLMPATAREEAQKAGLGFSTNALIDDAGYNMQLGSNHIERLIARYDGSYPLAFAAYNAGPGNVNRWLRENGDPRSGAISWLDWIERIPFFETKNYVHRVIENAVTYEHLYPEQAPFGQPRTIDDFLR